MATFQSNLANVVGGTLAIPYGKHVVSGFVVRKLTEGVGDNARTTVIVWLGEGPWNKITGYWGGAIISDADIHFHNGYLASSMDQAIFATNPATGTQEWSQGVDPWNVGGQTYSGTAYAIVKLPLGITADDDFAKLKFVCECLRVADYDEQGRQLDKDGNIVGEPDEAPKEEWFFYSTNAALCLADVMLVRYGRSKTRINWPWFVQYKNTCGELIPWVGGSVPDRPLFANTTANFSVGANASVLKDGGGNAWNCGGITESVFPDNTISFFEVDAGSGTWSMGVTQAADLTNSNQYYLGVQGNVTTAGDESGVLSVNILGNNTAFSTWVAGDRFRVGADFINGTLQLYISKNGERLNVSGIPPFVSGLHGGIALFHDGADILRSTMSPINSGTGSERVRPRFECGLAYTNSPDISSVIESILYVSCAEQQDSDGKLIFLPPTRAEAPRQTVFDFDESNILPDSFKVYRLAREQKPTKLPGRFRDTDTPTLKEATKSALREALIGTIVDGNVVGEIVDPEVYLGSCTSGQADCVLNYYMRRRCDLDLYCEFRTVGTAWKVLPGDPITVTKDEMNWDHVKFEVIDAIDESSIDTPDLRRFICQIFNENCYSDTDQTPLNSTVADLVTNEISTPERPTGFSATFLINAIRYKWDKPANFNLIREYEIWSSTDTSNITNRLWHGLADGWTEAFTSGVPDSITRFVRAISLVGTPSEFASVTQNTDIVVAPTNYTITYDNNFLHHTFSPSTPATGISRYEIATDPGFTNIIFSALATSFDEPVNTVGTPTRYLRAVSMLEKHSATVIASVVVSGPNPPTSAFFTYDGVNIRWTWTASTSPNIAYYEITDSTGNNIQTRTTFPNWSISQIRGTATYSYRVYAVTASGIRSNAFLPLTATISPPLPVSGLTVVFDANTGQIRWSWTSSPSIDVESVLLTDNAGSLPTLVANKNATSITEAPTENVTSLRRNVTVISTNGQVSSSVSAVFTAPAPVTPSITLNRQYPFSADINVNSAMPFRQVKSTVIVVSTGTGGAFDANIIQTLPEAGKQDRVTVFGRASQNVNLYVKVRYIDVWGQQSGLSNELGVTFTQFLGSDISNNTVTSLQLLLNNFDNLVDNPGLEKGSLGWTLNNGAAIVASGHSGINAIGRINLAGDSENPNDIKIDCKPGDQFYIECFVRASASAGGNAGVRIKWYDANSSFLSNTDFTLTQAQATSFSVVGGIGTAPANAVYAKPVFIILGQNSTSGSEWYLDDMYMRRVITSTIIGIGVINTAHIANLAVTNAQILNMSAEKLQAAFGDIGLLFAERIVSRDYVAVPGATTALNGSISDSATTITVDTTSGFPSAGAISVTNDDGSREVVYYTGKSSTTFTGCVRGQESSLAKAHPDNSVVIARGIGWMLHPQRGTTTPGVIEGNSNFMSQGIPATESTFRAMGAISENRGWKGNSFDKVPATYISRGFIDEYDADSESNRMFASIGINIDSHDDVASGFGSIDMCEIIIYNKFGERVGIDERRYRGWVGQGHIGDFKYDRKYADAWEEAVFAVRIHNFFGWTDYTIYISNGRASGSWGPDKWSATNPPTYLARQNCPLELTAISSNPDTIELRWQAPIANASTQNIFMRQRGADNRWSGWSNITSVSSTTASYTWSNASAYTDYEFYIENTGSAGAMSNIAYCKTMPQGLTTSRPAPSNVVGSVQSTTSIVWTWTRNATDNTDVEYSLDGGTWTALGSATATTTTSTVSAGTSHSLRVRNKWSSGTTLSAEASSNSVTTPANNPVSSDPSNLNLSVPVRGEIHAMWTNNGSVNQTLEYQVFGAGSWTSVSLGAVNNYDITGVADNTFYSVRVKATGGNNYVTKTILTQAEPDDDPFRDPRACVVLDSLITLQRGLVDEARNVVPGDSIMTGKYNIAEVGDIETAEVWTIFTIINENDNSLSCSRSHPFIINMEETEKMNAGAIAQAVINGDEVFVKMNDCGREYMAKITGFRTFRGKEKTKVWIPKLSHPDHTFISNKFVSHNIKVQ